jgi:hypothetical protein
MDIRMIKDILRLKYSGGLSHEAIARSLGCSKGVVAKYLGLAGAAGLDWQATAELDEAALERRLLGRSEIETRVVEADFARVHVELRRKGVTLMLLWQEYRAAFEGTYSRGSPKPPSLGSGARRSMAAALSPSVLQRPGGASSSAAVCWQSTPPRPHA